MPPELLVHYPKTIQKNAFTAIFKSFLHVKEIHSGFQDREMKFDIPYRSSNHFAESVILTLLEYIGN